MTPLTRLEGVAAPLPRANVDTDRILAGRFLKTVHRSGLGRVLFDDWRQDPEFVLNTPPWTEARILVALENFGCGSSREHAPWALGDFGIQCIIAPSIADIFYNNCFKNGILPVVLPRAEVDMLLELAGDPASCEMVVDLQQQTIATRTNVFTFAVDPKRKQNLLTGADEIAGSLTQRKAIARWEAADAAARSWLEPIDQTRLLAPLPQTPARVRF